MILEAFEVHDTLNPKLWDDTDHLHDDVKNRILAIVDEFVSNLDFKLRVADIYLVGSNASYNYTEYSDLDIHIVTNFDTYDADPTILQILFNALKSNFNNNYDIKIKGIDVELYVEDMNANTTSNGIYSVSRGDWIKHPQPIEVPDVDVTLSVHSLQDEIDEVLNSDDLDRVNEMIDHLYMLRKEGLIREGEYSEGNLIFKEIRNLGLLDALKSESYRLSSKELSLESKKIFTQSEFKEYAKYADLESARGEVIESDDTPPKAKWEDLPKYLYHATFEEFLDDIQEYGLGSKAHRKNMMGSDYSNHPIYSNDGIFLAVDPDEALAYIETDDRSNSDIVLLRIAKNFLQYDSIYVDTNNLDDGYIDAGMEMPDNVKTYFYSGVISDPISKCEVIDL